MTNLVNLTLEEWIAVGIIGVVIVVILILWGNYRIGKLRDAIDKWEPPVR
jgi:O-antigen ligase